ncbi:guanine nucleotide-binding protein G(I)/G(S)/G(O) subunit gamma-4 isoform 1-T1 [Guaruba guarouba]
MCRRAPNRAACSRHPRPLPPANRECPATPRRRAGGGRGAAERAAGARRAGRGGPGGRVAALLCGGFFVAATAVVCWKTRGCLRPPGRCRQLPVNNAAPAARASQLRALGCVVAVFGVGRDRPCPDSPLQPPGALSEWGLLPSLRLSGATAPGGGCSAAGGFARQGNKPLSCAGCERLHGGTSDIKLGIATRKAALSCRKNKMKELVSNSTTSISQARKAVEQLKMEAYMDRMKVSKAAADLLAYCDAHIGEDPLIIPVPASENPFREKKLFCTIL